MIKKMLKRGNRFIAMALALLLLLELSGNALVTNASEIVSDVGTIIGGERDTETQPLWDGITFENQIQTEKGLVTYSLTNQWEGGFNANITILNNSESDIYKWELDFVSYNELSDFWNGKVVENSEDVIVQGFEWNQKIAAGASVQFGFSGIGNFAGFPTAYELRDAGSDNEIVEPEREVTYDFENYSITQRIYDMWNGGYNAALEIRNIGENEIRNWYIQFENSCNFASASNAQILNYENGIITLKYSEGNTNIKAGESVLINYCCNESFAGFASEYSLVGDYSLVQDGDFDVNYILDNVWDGGFTGYITIHNLTDQTFEDWSLEFDYENSITSVWNGKLASDDNRHYVIKNADYNSLIEPDEFLSIGFLVNDGDVAKTLTNVKLFRYTLNEDGPVIENPIDDSVISDPIPRDENNYIKESTDADVVYDEYGFPYIKNQIVFMTYLGTDKRIIEKMVSEMDADIVGYIQSICFYQIEFRSDKSSEELEELIGLIEGHSYIMYAGLNSVDEEGQINYFPNDTLYNDGATCYNSYTDLNGDGKIDYGEVSVVFDTSRNDTNDILNPAGDNWGLEALNVPGAWDYLSSFPSNQKVKVGILDNMFGSHQDLDSQIVNRYNNPAVIDNIHGTHVAGIIGAGFDNNIGISGVATNVEMNGYSIVNLNTKAKKTACFNTIIDIEKAKAINISYGYSDGVIYSASHGDREAQKWIYNQNKEICAILKNLLLKGNDFLILQAAGNSNNALVVRNPSSKGYTFIDYDPDDHQGMLTYSGYTDPYYAYWTTAIQDDFVASHIVVVGAVQPKKRFASTKFYVTDFTNIGNRVDIYAPGYDILSTVPVTSQNMGYQLASGTSMAAPYITGLAALIWQANPDLTSLQVKSIMLESHGHEVLDAKGNTLTKTNGEVYYLPDAEKCVKKALSTYGVEWTHPELPSGTVQGYVVDVNNNPISGMKVMFIRTSSGQSNLDEYWFVEETDANGYYEKLLPQGTYEIIVSDENSIYVPYSIKNIEVLPDQVKILDTIIMEATSWMLAISDGKIKGSVYNALNGRAIAGANIVPRTGWNTHEGPNLLEVYCYGETVTSDASGNFDLTLPLGYYTLEISKDGYIIGYYNVVACPDEYTRRMNYVLTPVMAEGEYRIILTWGASPSDLDSHLTYYKAGSNSRAMHVYYSNKNGYIDGVKVAELDLDDTSSYGPETVTLTVDASILTNGGFFRYSVHDYTNGGSSGSSSKALSNSGAVVRVYTNNELLETYNVPANRTGNVWQVFTLSSSGLQTAGTFTTRSASAVE